MFLITYNLKQRLLNLSTIPPLEDTQVGYQIIIA